MSKKFNIWCDSGANSRSCRRMTVSLDELGLTDADWEAMTEEERDDVMKDIALDRLDWGYEEA